MKFLIHLELVAVLSYASTQYTCKPKFETCRAVYVLSCDTMTIPSVQKSCRWSPTLACKEKLLKDTTICIAKEY